jgi:lipopolysaccharide transport system permease protein
MQSLIQMLFLLSAIVFPLDRLIHLFPDQWQWLVRLNILSSIVEDARRVALKGLSPDWFWFNLDLAASVLLMLVGYACFMRFKGQFADVV